MTIRLDRLAFGYPGLAVGADVSLEIAAGEILVLLGPNGGGKTTLFKTVLGLIPSQGGAVSIAGRPLSAMSRREVAQTIGYVPQAAPGYFPFTVIDSVLMGRTARIGLFATPSSADRAVAIAMLDLLGIADLAERPYTAISGGQRQLTLIARALAQEPQFLVMDEPTASLDFGNQVKVLDHIAGLAQKGMGLVISTHDPDQAFLLADRVAILHAGRLMHVGRPEDVITEETLAAVYGVDVEMHTLASVKGRTGDPLRVSVPLSRSSS